MWAAPVKSWRLSGMSDHITTVQLHYTKVLKKKIDKNPAALKKQFSSGGWKYDGKCMVSFKNKIFEFQLKPLSHQGC